MSRSIKIAILSPSAPPVSTGGIATAHYALYEGLKSRGLDVHFYTFADFGSARFYRDSDPAISRFGTSWILAKGVQALGKIHFMLRERSFRFRIYQFADVLKSYGGARKIRAHFRKDPPDVVIFPDQASPAAWLKKSPGQRWIQVSHHQALRFVNQPEIGPHSLLDALAARTMEIRQLSQADSCVTPSLYMADVVRSFVTSEIRTVVIPNLVEVPASGHSGTKLKDGGARRIFIPSGGSRFKGSEVVPELILRILDAKRDEKLEFFISGDLSPAQREAILRFSPFVHLIAPGHLPHAEVMSHLEKSSVCVSPTWIENQSMALLEAKSMGVPFIAFNVGGNRELLGRDDRVTPRGDVKVLASAVVEHLKRDSSPDRVWDAVAHNERALGLWVQLLDE